MDFNLNSNFDFDLNTTSGIDLAFLLEYPKRARGHTPAQNNDIAGVYQVNYLKEQQNQKGKGCLQLENVITFPDEPFLTQSQNILPIMQHHKYNPHDSEKYIQTAITPNERYQNSDEGRTTQQMERHPELGSLFNTNNTGILSHVCDFFKK